jgi:hypothetical protein
MDAVYYVGVNYIAILFCVLAIFWTYIIADICRQLAGVRNEWKRFNETIEYFMKQFD